MPENGAVMKIKNYMVFTSLPYRILILVVFPLLLIGLELKNSGESFFLTQMIVMLIFVATEVIADNWVFGSVASKKENYLEYLLCSKRGSKVMRAALTVNMLRQLLTGAVFMLLGIVIYYSTDREQYLTGKQMILCLNLVLFGYFMITVQLLIARFLEGPLMSMSVAIIGMLAVMLGYYVVARFYLIMLPLLAVLSVIASILSVKIVMKRMEACCYDSTV